MGNYSGLKGKAITSWHFPFGIFAILLPFELIVPQQIIDRFLYESTKEIVITTRVPNYIDKHLNNHLNPIVTRTHNAIIMKFQSQTDKSSTNKNELTSGTKFRWSNNWIQEILALFTSAVLLIALSFFLSKFNDNLAPSFKYNIRLSTIAAIFSTLFRSFIISAIENG
jgi:predicted PurR-regulated permease PerM